MRCVPQAPAGTVIAGGTVNDDDDEMPWVDLYTGVPDDSADWLPTEVLCWPLPEISCSCATIHRVNLQADALTMEAVFALNGRFSRRQL